MLRRQKHYNFKGKVIEILKDEPLNLTFTLDAEGYNEPITFKLTIGGIEQYKDYIKVGNRLEIKSYGINGAMTNTMYVYDLIVA